MVFFVETGLHKGSLREGAGAVRRLRESALLCGQSKIPSHAGSFHRYRGPPPSRREAFACRFSADRGFGLPRDLARWTSTRYACSRRKCRESRKTSVVWLSKQRIDNRLFCFGYTIAVSVIAFLCFLWYNYLNGSEI